MTFDGMTTFRFTVKQKINVFTLHTYELSYSDIQLLNDEGTVMQIQNYSLDLNLQHLVSLQS